METINQSAEVTQQPVEQAEASKPQGGTSVQAPSPGAGDTTESLAQRYFGKDPSQLTGEEAMKLVKIQKGEVVEKKAPSEAKPQEKRAEAEKPEAAQPKRYKVKVDGQELEVDESELLRGYSHQRAANKKLQEGVALRKQAEQLIELMKDPSKLWEITEKLGHDPRALAEQLLAQKIEDELLDPKEKEFRDAQRKLKAYEEIERKQKEMQEQKIVEEMKAKYQQEYTQAFVSALQQEQLPATKNTIAEMAKYISRSAKLGYELTAVEAAKLVKEDIVTAQRNLIGNADGETLIKLLGEDLANKVREYDVKRIKSPDNFLKTPKEQGPRKTSRSPDKPMTAIERRKLTRGY